MSQITNLQRANILKNDLNIMLRKIRIDDEITKVKKKDRKEWVDLKLLEINQIVLKWALKNNIITNDDIRTDNFFTENHNLTDWIVTSGLIGGGAAGAAAAGTVAYGATLSTVTTGGFLGFFTTTSTVATTTTYVATAVAGAAPLALAALGGYIYFRRKEKKQIEKLINFFEKEKEKIYNYYAAKISATVMLPSGG